MTGRQKKRKVHGGEDGSKLGKLLEAHTQARSELERLERQIYELEGSYLLNTGLEGNIIAGWGNPKNFSEYARRFRGKVQRAVEIEDQRVFSSSSKSSPFYNQ